MRRGLRAPGWQILRWHFARSWLIFNVADVSRPGRPFMTTTRSRQSDSPAPTPRARRGPLLWPLAAIALGLLLLLDNFLLLEGFNASGLWPLLLVVAGAQILLRGDIIPGANARPFGITRGSVESGTVEISAGEIDVELRALNREGRLVAGQFAADSRPQLNVVDTHATLVMKRAQTPLLSLVDWQVALAGDLPWAIYMTTHLGQVNADLSGLIVAEVVIATGLGDVRVVCPDEAFGPIQLRSALGTIQIITPKGRAAQITAPGGPLFSVKFNETRYVQSEPGVYTALDAATDGPPIQVQISGAFGDAYLA
jgi:hypothetical protein